MGNTPIIPPALLNALARKEYHSIYEWSENKPQLWGTLRVVNENVHLYFFFGHLQHGYVLGSNDARAGFNNLFGPNVALTCTPVANGMHLRGQNVTWTLDLYLSLNQDGIILGDATLRRSHAMGAQIAVWVD